MANDTTIKKLDAYLEFEETKHHKSEPDEDGDVTYLWGVGDHDHTIGIFIRVLENGEFVQFRAVQFVDRDKMHEAIQDPQKKAAIYEYMLKFNYTRKLGLWALDPEDGDHYLTISVAIENNQEALTNRQIRRYIRSLEISAIEIQDELNKLIGNSRGAA
jgi:hypothetical protein